MYGAVRKSCRKRKVHSRVYFLRKTLNLFISRCRFAEEPKCKTHVLKSLSYKLEPIVQHCIRAALTGLITTENFPAFSLNRCLAHRFASCENIVSRSQALVPPSSGSQLPHQLQRFRQTRRKGNVSTKTVSNAYMSICVALKQVLHIENIQVLKCNTKNN